jgi:hypothetical protein
MRALLALVLLAAWLVLIVTPALQPPGGGAPAWWHARAPEAVLRFGPLGLVSVFVWRDRSLRLARALLVGLPAFGLGFLAACAAIWLADRAAGPPGPSDLLPAAAGVLIGVLVGLAWRRGLLALVLLPLKLLAVAVLAGVLLAGLLAGSLAPQPAVAPPRAVGDAERRELAAALRDKDPGRIPNGETRTLELSQEQLGRLVDLALLTAWDPARERASVAFEPGDRLAVHASLRTPLVGRWLNLAGSADLGVHQGRFFLGEPRLRLGPRELPPLLMDALAPVLARAVRAERRLRPALAAVHEAGVGDGVFSITYGHLDAAPGLFATVFAEAEAGDAPPHRRQQVEVVEHPVGPGPPKR